MSTILAAIRRWRRHEDIDDQTLVERARQGDEAAVRVLVRRYNQRLFRLARGVVRNDAEAEDIVQEAYVRAFTHLDTYRGDAAFATWLTRIALNEALGRVRHAPPIMDPALIEERAGSPDGGQVIMFPSSQAQATPETEAGREQVRDILEQAIDRLPEPFRVVFIARDVEGLSTEETATLLGIRPETAKTRLFRARRLMRAELEKVLAPSFAEAFPFAGARCARTTEAVIRRLRQSGS